MKRKLTTLLLLAFCVSIFAVGCGGGGQQAANEPQQQEEEVTGDGSWERAVEAGKITAGLDDAYPPMGYRDEDTGELIGFDIEMAAAISEKIGVPIEFVPADWNSIVPSILSGKFDLIISGMNAWPERKEQVDFVCYGIATQVIVVPESFSDDEAVMEQGIGYFLDKQLGGQLGSTGAKNAISHGFVDGGNLRTYATFPQAMLDMQAGRLDAVIIDSFGAGELLKEGGYKLVGEAVWEEGASKDAAYIGIAVRKEDKELQEKLQQAVDELLEDGTLSELSMKWIGADITEGM